MAKATNTIEPTEEVVTQEQELAALIEAEAQEQAAEATIEPTEEVVSVELVLDARGNLCTSSEVEAINKAYEAENKENN